MKHVSRICSFAAIGAFSGFCSGVLVAIPPLGLIVPGLSFGLAIVLAIPRKLTAWKSCTIIILSCVGYWTAIFASLLCVRIFGSTGLSTELTLGAISGGVGSAVVAISLVSMKEFRCSRILIPVISSGAIAGALFVVLGIYISDHTALGHPADDLICFPIWHAAVAAAVGASFQEEFTD